jgi:hypothetical protein
MSQPKKPCRFFQGRDPKRCLDYGFVHGRHICISDDRQDTLCPWSGIQTLNPDPGGGKQRIERGR